MSKTEFNTIEYAQLALMRICGHCSVVKPESFWLQLPVVTLGLEYSGCVDRWLNNSVRRWFTIMMFLSI